MGTFKRLINQQMFMCGGTSAVLHWLSAATAPHS
jgi:hypothetical protein